jgi:putative membrane protein
MAAQLIAWPFERRWTRWCALPFSAGLARRNRPTETLLARFALQRNRGAERKFIQLRSLEEAMKQALIAAIALLAISPAFAQSAGEKTGVNSTLGISPSTRDFVQEAAISDKFEIASSNLAQNNLTGADKDFATQMISDHTKTSDQLSSVVKSENIPIPTDLDSSHKSLLDKLSSLKGGDFRKQYFDDQVSAHKDAVSLFQRYGKGGDNQTLKSWASTTLPTLQHHLDMAQELDKK